MIARGDLIVLDAIGEDGGIGDAHLARIAPEALKALKVAEADGVVIKDTKSHGCK